MFKINKKNLKKQLQIHQTHGHKSKEHLIRKTKFKKKMMSRRLKHKTKKNIKLKRNKMITRIQNLKLKFIYQIFTLVKITEKNL